MKDGFSDLSAFVECGGWQKSAGATNRLAAYYALLARSMQFSKYYLAALCRPPCVCAPVLLFVAWQRLNDAFFHLYVGQWDKESDVCNCAFSRQKPLCASGSSSSIGNKSDLWKWLFRFGFLIRICKIARNMHKMGLVSLVADISVYE